MGLCDNAATWRTKQGAAIATCVFKEDEAGFIQIVVCIHSNLLYIT